MLKEIAVVIGANYGDEGKGLWTSKVFAKEKRVCVVLSNGSCQRGHTVVTETKKGPFRHVYQHFGSQTHLGHPTYIPPETFYPNPIHFRQEYETLVSEGFNPVEYVDEEAPIVTVFDELINQCWEASLGEGSYGSCGYGVYEAVIRNRWKKFSLRYKDLTSDNLKKKLENIYFNYFPKRLKEVCPNGIPEQYQKIVESDLVTPFLEDCRFFRMKTFQILKNNRKEFLQTFTHLVFENGQGLLLDPRHESKGEHVTPVGTTIDGPLKFLIKNKLLNGARLTVYYCSRWYMTRHGNGPLPFECKPEDISPKIVEKTNVYNQWQGNFRYALLDFSALGDRLYYEYGLILILAGCNYPFKIKLILGHVDELPENDVKYIYKGTNVTTTSKAFKNNIGKIVDDASIGVAEVIFNGSEVS